MIYLYILFGSIITHTLNMILLKLNLFSMSVLSIFPLIYIQMILYAYYYKEGIKYHNYTVLILISFSFNIICSFLIQQFYLKQSFNLKSLNELIGIIFILIGLFIYLKKP